MQLYHRKDGDCRIKAFSILSLTYSTAQTQRIHFKCQEQVSHARCDFMVTAWLSRSSSAAQSRKKVQHEI